jgi:hypothetical protein
VALPPVSEYMAYPLDSPIPSVNKFEERLLATALSKEAVSKEAVSKHGPPGVLPPKPSYVKPGPPGVQPKLDSVRTGPQPKQNEFTGVSEESLPKVAESREKLEGGPGVPQPKPFKPKQNESSTELEKKDPSSFKIPNLSKLSTEQKTELINKLKSAYQEALDLPKGWEQGLDPVSDQYYYHNIETGETQWERPQF